MGQKVFQEMTWRYLKFFNYLRRIKRLVLIFFRKSNFISYIGVTIVHLPLISVLSCVWLRCECFPLQINYPPPPPLHLCCLVSDSVIKYYSVLLLSVLAILALQFFFLLSHCHLFRKRNIVTEKGEREKNGRK